MPGPSFLGMRGMHQALPGILNKLGIDEEFKLDMSESGRYCSRQSPPATASRMPL